MFFGLCAPVFSHKHQEVGKGTKMPLGKKKKRWIGSFKKYNNTKVTPSNNNISIYLY